MLPSHSQINHSKKGPPQIGMRDEFTFDLFISEHRVYKDTKCKKHFFHGAVWFLIFVFCSLFGRTTKCKKQFFAAALVSCFLVLFSECCLRKNQVVCVHIVHNVSQKHSKPSFFYFYGILQLAHPQHKAYEKRVSSRAQQGNNTSLTRTSHIITQKPTK